MDDIEMHICMIMNLGRKRNKEQKKRKKKKTNKQRTVSINLLLFRSLFLERKEFH